MKTDINRFVKAQEEVYSGYAQAGWVDEVGVLSFL